MARGFESKSVASQQESAFGALDRGDPDRTPEDPVRQQRRQRLLLTRADLRRQLEAARAEPHRAMLSQALQAVEAELGAEAS